MPRLEEHPEYKYAARLAKVGPETWNSWINALAAVASGFQDLTKDAPMGTVLRQIGTGVPRTKLEPEKQLEQAVLDYMVPQASGVIKGLKAGIRKGKPEALKLRQTMKAEFAQRGKPQESGWLDNLLRGTAYHGSRYERLPQLGEVFNIQNFRSGNLGEPTGMSLTYNPILLFGEKATFAKHPDKLDRIYHKLDDQEQKLADKYHDLKFSLDPEKTPTEVAEIKAQMDKISRQRQAIVAKIVATTPDSTKLPFARVLPRFHGQPEDAIVKGWKGSGDDELMRESYTYAIQQTPELWDYTKPLDYGLLKHHLPNGSEERRQFNTHIAQYLQSKGKRGILYLPQRYNEYELRIFDPQDVVMLDIRKVNDKQWDRVFGESSSRMKTIEDWERESARAGLGSAHSYNSLGNIYRDVDLTNLQPWSDEVRRATAEQVKTSVLSQMMQTQKAGLRVGKAGYSRGVGRGTEEPYSIFTSPESLHSLDGYSYINNEVYDLYGQHVIGPKAKEIFKEKDWYTNAELATKYNTGQLPVEAFGPIDLTNIPKPNTPEVEPGVMQTYDLGKVLQQLEDAPEIDKSWMEQIPYVSEVPISAMKTYDLGKVSQQLEDAPGNAGSSIKVKLKPPTKIPVF